MPETVSTYDRLLVSVTLEKREGACALFVQKTPDMFTNLQSARKTLLNPLLSPKNILQVNASGYREQSRTRDTSNPTDTNNPEDTLANNAGLESLE